MANRKKGIRIGNYRITPLGIGTIIALIVIIAAVIIILRALSDTTIYLPEDIAALAGITVLGQIPAIDVSANSKFTAWTLLEGGAEHHAEQEKQS